GTTISGNRTAGSEGGFDFAGTQLNLLGDSITNNTAGASAGGVLVFATNGGTIRNTTISGNRAAGDAGGVESDLMGGTPTVAGNTANATRGPDLNGVFTSQGFNFIGVDSDISEGFTNGVKNDQVGSVAVPKVALLGPLQNNGGPTFSQALLPGSPALGKGEHT